ncbi:MAG: type-4 uracil-DNA glycosylase [Candidatus Bathyarchaeia archaeon]
MVSELQSKHEVFQQLIAEVSECKRCELWRVRRKPVLGDGNVNTSTVFIGEAPGYWEDIKGKPFVGSAGNLLNRILEKVGISRNDIYITNVVKCRPPGNRDPRQEEIEACRNYLDRQLDAIRPSIIVTLGRHSTAYIFLKAGIPFKSISESQGKVYETRFWETKTYIVVSYHPAAALYNVKLEKEIEKALRVVKMIQNGKYF